MKFRKRGGMRVLLLMVVLAMVAAACGDSSSDTTTATTAATTTTTGGDAGDTTTTTEVMVTPINVPGYSSWEEVLAAAEGTTVNWFMWGGSDTINANVDNDIGDVIEERFGVTLNRVPIGETAEAVNKVLDEKAAGVDSGGTIDLIWINGENFSTLKQADLLYGPWSEEIPNAQYVDWDDPAVASDFGEPVNGLESPWGGAQFEIEYNSEFVPDPPTTFEDLQAWIKANPGLFTYPAIPDFTGSVFVRHVFYWVAGDTAPFLGPFDQAVFDQYAPAVWEYLNDIEPDLWRGGDTYPEAAAMIDLLANQEIHYNMGYGPGRATTNINDGIYPESIRTFVFDTGTLSNTNYITIPFNAANPAGAMVLANYMLTPEFQLVMADPDQWGWLIPTDPSTWPAEDLATLNAYGTGIATLPASELAAKKLPEPLGDWVTAMEAGWIENVLEK